MSTTIAPDRAAIALTIETAVNDFGKLVGEIGDAGWKKRSGIPAWTCGQLAWHVGAGLAFMAGQIESASKGKALNPPSFLLPAIYKLSEFRVRLVSRKATLASVQADLEAGKARLLGVLNALDDAALGSSATMMGEERTIAEMFRLPVEHSSEHAAEIRTGLAAA